MQILCLPTVPPGRVSSCQLMNGREKLSVCVYACAGACVNKRQWEKRRRNNTKKQRICRCVHWLIVCMCDPWVREVWLTITFVVCVCVCVCACPLQELNTIWNGPPGTLIPSGSSKQLRCCMNVIYFQTERSKWRWGRDHCGCLERWKERESEEEKQSENTINGEGGYFLFAWVKGKVIVLLDCNFAA